MFKFYICLLFSMLLLACEPPRSLGPSSEDSLATAAHQPCGFALSASAGGRRISWKKQLPIKIEIATFPSEFISAVHEAANIWNQQTKMSLFTVVEPSSSYKQVRGDRKNSLMWLSPWTSSAHFQALTFTMHSGDLIYEADILINGSNFNFVSSSSLAQDKYHLQSLLVHEFGHVLGLQHTRTASVMWPELLPNVIRTQPTTEDITNLQCEYSK